MNSECPLCGAVVSGDECNCGLEADGEICYLILIAHLDKSADTHYSFHNSEAEAVAWAQFWPSWSSVVYPVPKTATRLGSAVLGQLAGSVFVAEPYLTEEQKIVTALNNKHHE